MKKKILALVLASVAVLTSFVSCGRSANADSDMSYAEDKAEYDERPGSSGNSALKDEAYSSIEGGFTNGELGASEAVSETVRKRIQYVTVSMESTEYDVALNSVKAKCQSLGGYIESSNEYGLDNKGRGSRYATLVFRIPQEKLNEFTDGITSAGNVLSFTTDSDDVTEKYYDIEARLASLEAQRDRYMALLEKAEIMEDILVIDQALSEVIYQIESYTGTLNKYDALVSYSTVTLYINEVVTLTEPVPVDPTFGERIAEAFKDSLEAFEEMIQKTVIFIVAAIPFIIVPAAIVIVLIAVISTKSRKRRKSAVIAQIPSTEKETYERKDLE